MTFLARGIFSIHDIWKMIKKYPAPKIFFVSKNQFCHARQPCKGFFEICIVFSHFSARASNGPQYSNFGNKCPKLGPGTLEDMLFTNLGETLDSVPSGIVLISTLLYTIIFFQKIHAFWHKFSGENLSVQRHDRKLKTSRLLIS